MVRQEFIFLPPCFFETKKRFVRGGDVERSKSTKSTGTKIDLVDQPTKSMGQLVDQPTKSNDRLTRKISRLTKQSCRFTELKGSYVVTIL